MSRKRVRASISESSSSSSRPERVRAETGSPRGDVNECEEEEAKSEVEPEVEWGEEIDMSMA